MVDAGEEMGAPPAHVIVRGGRVLDGDGWGGGPADILIEGDTIRAIGPPGMGAPADAAPVDATDRLILPGLVNAHTHGDATLAKGLGDRWTLELLLNAAPLRRHGVGLRDKALAARLAAAEMVSNGITACYDLFSEFPAPTPEGLEAVAGAYAEVGVRAVVAHDRLEAANRESRDLVRRLEPAVSAFCVGLCREPFPVHRYADHGIS